MVLHIEEEKAGGIRIADLTGKVWLAGIKAAGQTVFETNVRQFPAGVYIVTFRSETGHLATGKLVVQRR
jgi:hypothetical protein